jgi:hypothetical protein
MLLLAHESKEALAMPHQWPSETVFQQVDLFLHGQVCEFCEADLYVCGHRKRRVFALDGPRLLWLRLGHCPHPDCQGHSGTVSPWGEMAIAPPRLAIAWDVFAWIGHRRFARHWSIPQIRGELQDSREIDLSPDAIEDYVRQYQVMVAARHTDIEQLRKVYASTKSLLLSIDGIQPEKGHETLYVVRELSQKRVWFAEPLLSSAEDEVRRLFVRAREIAAALERPVGGWMSDKQEAFLKGIAAEFPGKPHGYCQNHFLRDLAKPVLEADSHAKVQMRRKVRGLRAIQQAVLAERSEAPVSAEKLPQAAPQAVPTALPQPVSAALPQPVSAAQEVAVVVAATVNDAAKQGQGTAAAAVCETPLEPSPAGQLVLDYCTVVRGILNDDQGGPLHPPGLRMADALKDVRESLQQNLRAKKGGLQRSRCSV